MYANPDMYYKSIYDDNYLVKKKSYRYNRYYGGYSG